MDPFAQHRQQTIAEREDEYRARRRQMVISPPRHDPFADGRCCRLTDYFKVFFMPVFLMYVFNLLQGSQVGGKVWLELMICPQ